MPSAMPSQVEDLIEALRALSTKNLPAMCNAEFDLYLRQLALAKRIIEREARRATAHLHTLAPLSPLLD